MINCSSRPLEVSPVWTHKWTAEGFHLIRILTGPFTAKLKEGQHRQLCPPGASEQDTVQVHLCMPWRTSKGWKSEKADTGQTKLAQKWSPVIPQALLPMALLVFILFSTSWEHARQSSPTALLNPTLLWSSQRIYPLKWAPKAQAAPDKLSKYCTSFHSLLSFCNCLPSWVLVSLLHNNYGQHHSQLSHIQSTSPVSQQCLDIPD